MTRRAGLAALGAALAAAALCAAACGRGEPPAELSAAGGRASSRELWADARIAPLVAGCERDEHFDVDTSDVGAVLVATLERGQMEPLRRAKAELALGPASDRERVRLLFERHWSDPSREAVLSNALDVALLADDGVLAPILARAVGHASQALRIQGLRGLAKHGAPEHFELVRARLEGTAEVEFDAALAALPATDRARAEALLAEWIAEGALEAKWGMLAGVLAAPQTEALRAAEAAGWRTAPKEVLPYFAAGLLTAPETAGPELDPAVHLGVWIAGGDAELASAALDACAKAAAWPLVLAALEQSAEPALRVRALNALVAASAAPGAAADPVLGSSAWLVPALDAREPELRAMALAELARRGDAQALDRALAMLAGAPADRQVAWNALAPRLAEDPALSARVLAALESQLAALESELASAVDVEQQRALFEMLGRLPLGEARELLLAAAARAEGRIAGFEAHRWLVLQLANGGPAAVERLALELAREVEPARRLDLLEALSAPGSDAARAALLDFVQTDGEDPSLLLYAASRLASIGPARSVLPVLKRVCLRIEEPRARTGFQCLLWHWYPRPL